MLADRIKLSGTMAMHAMIMAFGLSVTLATPAMAEMRVEQGVRVHRGPAATAPHDAVRKGSAATPEARRTVVLDRSYGSGTAPRRLIGAFGVQLR